MSECQYLHFDVSQIHLSLVEVEVAFGTVFIIGKFEQYDKHFLSACKDFNSFHMSGNLLSRNLPKAVSPSISFCGLILTSDKKGQGSNERDSTYRAVY